MRKSLSLIGFVCVAAFSACDKSATDVKPPNVPAPSISSSPVPTVSIPKDGNYEAKGVVTKIDNKLGSIELKHEEIKDLMPAMQMEFFVKDKTILKGLAIGDRVDFVIEYKHPTETVVSIKKTQ